MTRTVPRKTIHQFHYSASPGDAISNQMRFLRDVLADNGVGGEIFSVDIKPGLGTEVKPFESKLLWNADLVLVHHSHGNPALPAVLGVEVPKALVYHNVTPPEHFRHDEKMRKLSEMGVRQLREFPRTVKFAFADSYFNALDLERLGVDDVHMLPLFHAPDLRVSTKRSSFKKGGKLRLVFVGRVTPHKNQAFLLEMVSHLTRRFGIETSLHIVGGKDPVYGKYLHWLRGDLGISNSVKLEGKVSEERLLDSFVEADAFVCASLHEGYCIPLAQAMGASLPVFALAAGAIPETLDGAGVLIDEKNPETFAAIVAAAATADGAMDALSALSKERFSEIATLQTKETAVDTLRKTLQLLEKSPA